jgi:hypothetical protein
VSFPRPGRDEVVLTDPDGVTACNRLGCARAGTLAEVIVTYGVLNDPDAGYYHSGALWRESWHKPVPMCGGCWQSSRQVAEKRRPALVVIDTTLDGPAPAAPQPSGGRA